MEILEANNPKVIEKAVAVLKEDGILIYPTETVYGLGVDATNPEAVKKLFEYKGGRDGKAVSIAVPDMTMAEDYVELNETARHLYQVFSDWYIF